jgi:ribonuclease HII
MKRYLVGVDEVGRGPLAGPVSVGIVVVERGFDFSVFGDFTDSKKMTEKARERVYERASDARARGNLNFGVYSEPATLIDERGIVHALRSCIARGLEDLKCDAKDVSIFLDGSLKAPDTFEFESIVRGDLLVPAISLASVIAKVERDRYMKEVAHTAFPQYGFSSHKGYGTLAHRNAIQKYGITTLHRRTFIY